MSKAIALKLKDEYFEKTEKILKKLKKPRNAYINDAIQMYNNYNERKLLKEQLRKESSIVKKNSLEVLAEYEKTNDLFE